MKWFKCSNTIALNPKLGIVAQHSKCYKHEVIACWLYLLTEASRNNDKGDLGNIDFDAIDYALDFTPSKSKKIFDAFCAKGLVADNAITGWLEYQADPTNAARQKKYREKSKVPGEIVTESNSYITLNNEVTPEEKRREEKRVDIIDDDYRRKQFLEISLEVQKLMQGRIMATQGIHAWLDAGADKELILETLKVLIARKGGEPPTSLKYFNQAIADALAAKNNPLPKGNQNDRHIRQGARSSQKPTATESVLASAELIRSGQF